MSKDTVEIVVAIIGCIIGIGGVIAAVFARWRASIEKGYAAQRDFQHLRRNQEQMVENLNQIIKDQDRRLDTIDLALNRIESLLHTTLSNQHRRQHDDNEHFR